MKKMKTMLLTLDLEEFDWLKKEDESRIKYNQYTLSYVGLNKILTLLKKYNIKATFFTTASFAQKYPKAIQMLSKTHEIALHGMVHKDDYSKLSPQQAYLKLKRAKQILEKMTNKLILGFRAPRFYAPNYEVLKKLNLKYDSTLLPTYLPLSKTYTLGKPANLFKKRAVFSEKGIIEVPISTIPLLRLPFLWIVFRNMPLFINKIFTLLSIINTGNINLVFHPWEFIDITKLKLPVLMRRNTGDVLLTKLEKYLQWCIKNDFKFSAIGDYIKHA